MIYAFHECVLDTTIYTLTRNGETTRLRPKVFQVLQYLLDCRERVVSKQELVDAIWPDQFISDATLEGTISAVRRVLGDSGRAQRIIQTRTGHGYRFIAMVTDLSDPPGSELLAPVQSVGEEPSVEIGTRDLAGPTELVPEIPTRIPEPSEGEETIGTPSTGVASPDAERRQLTVLFCDLIESMQLMNQLDLEDYREVVRAYQLVCADAVKRFDGHIAQYLGDGLLIYFGYPSAHEDDAQRAVWTGLEIIEEINETLNGRLQRTHRVDIAVRLGIHTGPVIIGDIGDGSRQEQLALGETPSIASRLQELAEPNTLVISDATARLVGGYFTLEDLGLHHLKGGVTPMPLSRVLGGSGAQSRFDVAEALGVLPLVGRQHEVGLLMQRWEQVRDGQGQVVVLSGEAGIGKSRLVLAVKEQIATQSHYRVEWQTSPYYQHTPLYPIAAFARRLLKIEPEDTAADKLAKAEQVLERFHLSLEESVPLVADLLAFPVPVEQYVPLTLSPQAQRRRTLLALVTLFQELAERHPLLFVIEDLHWADPSTLELLDLLLEQIPTTSILALLTYRLEFQRTWEVRSYFTNLRLSPLPQGQMAELATLVTKGQVLPAEVLDYIVGKTDGVPLFAEEMTKAMMETGRLTKLTTRGETHGPQPSVTIPETLQDSLMSRLDQLESAKIVAQYASVIGREFPYELLEILLPLEAAIIQRELSRLVDLELIYQRGRIPHAIFIFKHSLVQDTAYQSLLRGTRRQLHEQIADFLERQGDELVAPEPELLAYHYTAAGLIEKAVTSWRLAGRVAMSRSAHVEAMSHLMQGVTLLEHLPETPERSALELSLQTSLGATFIATKGYAALEVEQAYRRARELCQEPGNSARLLQVLFGLQAVYLTRGELQTARKLGEECLELATHQCEPPRLPHAHFALGSTLFFLGDFILARDHLEQGASLYDPQLHSTSGLNDTGVSCLILTAWTLALLGYPDQALARMQEALDLSRELASPFSLAYALACAPLIYQTLGDAPAAQEYAEAGRKLSKEQDFPHWFALSTTLEGWSLAAQGRAPEGLELMQQGLQAWRDTGAEQTVPYQLALLAEAYGKSGQVEDGLGAVTAGLATAEPNAQNHYLAELYRLQGELVLAQPETNHAVAQDHFNQALRIARTQKAKSLELRAAISLSRLWQRQGKLRDAHALLAEVYAWFTEGFDTVDLLRARSLLDELSD